MELPDDILKLVKEYSIPLTRPDWRKLRRMNEFSFHCHIFSRYNSMNIPVINSFVNKYEKDKTAKYKYFRYVYDPKNIAYILPK